jgi:hypothetical protein
MSKWRSRNEGCGLVDRRQRHHPSTACAGRLSVRVQRRPGPCAHGTTHAPAGCARAAEERQRARAAGFGLKQRSASHRIASHRIASQRSVSTAYRLRGRRMPRPQTAEARP